MIVSTLASAALLVAWFEPAPWIYFASMRGMNKIKLLMNLGRDLGWSWLGRRVWYAVKRRFGSLERRLPVGDWADYAFSDLLDDGGRRACSLSTVESPDRVAELYRSWDTNDRNPVEVCDQLKRGEYTYFHELPVKAPYPPRWHCNPVTGQEAPGDVHFSRISDFAHGDIKFIWEAGRFGFVFPLVRAYRRTGDESYRDAFVELVRDWRQHNPPHAGPQWMCGQEASFRVMAWCFAIDAFGLDESCSEYTELLRMIAVTGRRIECNIAYALNQDNNHGISEATALWSIGLMFPWFKDAGRWVSIGRKALESQAERLIYEDGSFSQHSFNYQRLMLHNFAWAIRIGELCGQSLSTHLLHRVRASVDQLCLLIDPKTGSVPNYGHNDGALILPLNNSHPDDFRPVVQLLTYTLSGTLRFPPGPWNEDLIHMFGDRAVDANVRPIGIDQTAWANGGYHLLRSVEGSLFTRCCSEFRHRPAHSDLLHVDVRWRGVNITLDAGTYSYNATDRWYDAFAGTRFHNTVTVDGRDQSQRVGRFLWLPFPHGTVTSDGWWQGEHDGYGCLGVKYRRRIRQLEDDHWLIVDDLSATGEHAYRLHWLLGACPHEWDVDGRCLKMDTSGGEYVVAVASTEMMEADVVEADAESSRGWWSPSYGVLRPAVSLACVSRGVNVRFASLLGPRSKSVRLLENAVECAYSTSTASFPV